VSVVMARGGTRTHCEQPRASGAGTLAAPRSGLLSTRTHRSVMGEVPLGVKGTSPMTDTLRVHIVQPSLLHHRLRAWHRAVELVQLVHLHPIGDAELREQANRAARSCALNIAEGAALRGAAKRRHFVIAQGSLVETVAAYELAAAIGERVPVARVQELGAMLSAMLGGLIRGREL